jgi:hypothetical protein
VSFCECSAKTGEGVSAVFDLLVQHVMTGGWRLVAGMATPAHVPDEATLAAALSIHPTPRSRARARRGLVRCGLRELLVEVLVLGPACVLHTKLVTLYLFCS